MVKWEIMVIAKKDICHIPLCQGLTIQDLN
jgi:hypothetical protein